jgi:Flp pilus assembly protein TadD
MKASESGLREVKRSEKIGGLHKNVGLAGCAGLARLFCKTGPFSFATGDFQRDSGCGPKTRPRPIVAGLRPVLRPPRPHATVCRLFRLRRDVSLAPFILIKPGSAKRYVSSHANKPQHMPPAVWGWMVAALLCATAGGCSNIASQAANVEGVRLYQQGNYQQASDRFQQAIAQNPKSPDGYYNLAAALHKTGTLYSRPSDLQQAENLYNQCLERDPEHTECYRGLAVLLNESGRQQEAFKLLNHWSSASPKSPDPKIELARLLEEVGQAEQAKAQLVDALTIDPHNARALTALGRLRDQSGDHMQALANYQRSLSLNRFQPEVAARLAQLQSAPPPPHQYTAPPPPQTTNKKKKTR